MSAHVLSEMAVLMRREAVQGPMARWQSHRWVLADVLPQEAGFGDAPRCLRQADDEALWLYPGFRLELFTDDAVELHGKETGRVIERFTFFERSAHWSNAIAFVLLAITGVVIAYGKYFLLPVMGGDLFGLSTYGAKNIHNFAGPLFAVSLVVIFFTFVKDNIPSKEVVTWLLKGGGMFSGSEVPSHRFNAGEKVVFWGGVLFLGLIVVSSGMVLNMLVPGLIYERGTMQIASMIHGVASAFMMAMFVVHIYMGTLGQRGAFKGMKTGYVDETWAKEHHELWYNDVMSGKIPAQRSGAAPASPKATTASA